LFASPPFFYENLHEILNSHLPSEVTVFPTIFDSFPFSFLNYAIFARVYREIQKKLLLIFRQQGEDSLRLRTYAKNFGQFFLRLFVKA
jgi:hypothetical protein